MSRRRIAVLGSTGSVGTQALDVAARFPDRFEVVGLCAGRVDALVAQARAVGARFVAVKKEGDMAAVQAALPGAEVRGGVTGGEWLAALPEVDFVLSAISGGDGMRPTAAAVEAGKVVGLANKESIVLAGEWLTGRARATGATLLPIDSEHSAIFQCLTGERRESIRRLVLTASGGPFWNQPGEALENATPEQALRHPNWSMGKKITIDSATLMNKALEVIEARWLFDLPPDRIGVLIHPQSVVHSMVELRDGAILAQLGISDMRGPISYALGWPERLPLELPRLDLAALGPLSFAEPDHRRFPALNLAYRALKLGGTAPAMLSGADEACVAAFLDGRLPLRGIAEVVAQALEAHVPSPIASVEDAWQASALGLKQAEALIAQRTHRSAHASKEKGSA
jgi:1-deoxy-D-xylulose-5-phosphate reductoisomerase